MGCRTERRDGALEMDTPLSFLEEPWPLSGGTLAGLRWSKQAKLLGLTPCLTLVPPREDPGSVSTLSSENP